MIATPREALDQIYARYKSESRGSESPPLFVKGSLITYLLINKPKTDTHTNSKLRGGT